MTVTTITIAKLANTTHATVSRALRDDPSISPETRKRIKKLAQQLGYQPNLLARGLVKGKTHTVGLLMSSYQLETGATKVVVLDELASKKGYKLFVSYTKGELKRTVDSANELIARGVDGLLIYGSYLETPPAKVKEMFDCKVPVVFFDTEKKFPCKQVVQDKSEGVIQAVYHLHQLGHKEIYMLFAHWASWEKDTRFKGFVRAMKKFGYHNPQNRILPITYSGSISEDGKQIYDYDDIIKNIKEFLQTHPNCTAVICGNDIVAMNLINAAWDLGLKVPDDLSVVGFDDLSTSRYTHPPLTTVAQPIGKIVSAAWDLLLDAIENENTEPKKIVIPSELVIRKSTTYANTHTRSKDKL